MATTGRTYYTVTEAARVLGVNRSTVWRWIRAGRIPAYRVGPRVLRLPRGGVESLAEAEERPATRVIRDDSDFARYHDPEAIRSALARYAGAWSDLDAEALIAGVRRGREEGSRPLDDPATCSPAGRRRAISSIPMS